jgi:hypothetical protein
MFLSSQCQKFTPKKSIFNFLKMLQCKLHLMSQSKSFMVMDFLFVLELKDMLTTLGNPILKVRTT